MMSQHYMEKVRMRAKSMMTILWSHLKIEDFETFSFIFIVVKTGEVILIRKNSNLYIYEKLIINCC